MSRDFPRVVWITWYSLSAIRGADDLCRHAVISPEDRPDGFPGVYGSATLCGRKVGYKPRIAREIVTGKCPACEAITRAMPGKPRLGRAWMLGFMRGGNGRPESDNPYNEPGHGVRTSRPAFCEAWRSGWLAACEWRKK